MPTTIGRLHLITPEGDAPAILAATDAALRAGAPVVQVRRKAGTDRDRLAMADAVVGRCRAAGAACVVDDRADLALAAGADGVHVGAEDLPVARVRELVGSLVIGATCRTPEDARRAADAGADYLGAGPVYATTTKDGLPDPIGLDGLAAVAAAVELPVIAIAGITAARVAEVLDAGAHGVAVIAAVYAADDPAGATAAFLDALGEPVGAR